MIKDFAILFALPRVHKIIGLDEDIKASDDWISFLNTLRILPSPPAKNIGCSGFISKVSHCSSFVDTYRISLANFEIISINNSLLWFAFPESGLCMICMVCIMALKKHLSTDCSISKSTFTNYVKHVL